MADKLGEAGGPTNLNGVGHNKKKIPIPCKNLKNQQVRFQYDATLDDLSLGSTKPHCPKSSRILANIAFKG